jgi:hypothetical protein
LTTSRKSQRKALIKWMDDDTSTSEVESEDGLPDNLHNIRHCLCMEVEESSGDDDNDEEACTANKHLEDLQHKAVLAQDVSKSIPGSTFQFLCDHSKLRKASTQLTEEVKKSHLDVIVRARATAMIGLLNIYSNENLKYSWRTASEIVARTQG